MRGRICYGGLGIKRDGEAKRPIFQFFISARCKCRSDVGSWWRDTRANLSVALVQTAHERVPAGSGSMDYTAPAHVADCVTNLL